MHNLMENVCTQVDTLSNKLNELRLILEASCYDTVVVTKVMPKDVFFTASKSLIYLAGYQLSCISDFYVAIRGARCV